MIKTFRTVITAALAATVATTGLAGCAMLKTARATNDARNCRPANTWFQPAWSCGVGEPPPPAPDEPPPEEPPPANTIAPAPVTRAILKADKIEILEKVQFETGSADISEASFALLDDVAKILEDNKAVKIRVEGHTDSKGSKRSNKRLSNDRAEAVMEYLVDKGIDQSRLSAKGYGQGKPIDSNKTDEGRARNRRVEFNIVK